MQCIVKYSLKFFSVFLCPVIFWLLPGCAVYGDRLFLSRKKYLVPFAVAKYIEINFDNFARSCTPLTLAFPHLCGGELLPRFCISFHLFCIYCLRL